MFFCQSSFMTLSYICMVRDFVVLESHTSWDRPRAHRNPNTEERSTPTLMIKPAS